MTWDLLNLLIWIGTAMVCLPMLLICLECWAAWCAPRRELTGPRPRVDVLIPAHDEAAVIQGTLDSLRVGLREDDRIWVVADNCSDETAEIARRRGVRVLEREDAERRGKGFALDFGIQAIGQDDPAPILLIVDADCYADRRAIDLLARQVEQSGRPAQASYVMYAPAGAGAGAVVSEGAVLIKNHLRLLGLKTLGGPCLLTGSGMAFPWETIRGCQLASGHIVEDMQLACDLLIGGQEPLLCEQALIRAALPTSNEAARGQRQRWEHGHLQTLLTMVPRMLASAVRQRRWKLALIAADLAVPPVSLLICGFSLLLALAMLFFVSGGSWYPAAVLVSCGLLFAVTISASLSRFFPGRIGWRQGVALPKYVLGKLPLYAGFVVRPQKTWIRTARDPMTVPEPKLHSARGIHFPGEGSRPSE